MLEDLDSGEGIAAATTRLLQEADARGRLPTPVEDIIAAAKLEQPAESLLSEAALVGVPEHLAAKMRRLRGKVHAVLDRRAREIHVSPDIDHDGQRRFKQLHEVAHDILPWQSDLAYADDGSTLSWTTRVTFEQEANQGGAELLFQRRLFAEMASDYTIGFGAVMELADQFGASYHASFRRYVETHNGPMAGLVLERRPCAADPLGYARKEAVNSRSWTDRYECVAGWPKVIYAGPFDFVKHINLLSDEPLRTALVYPDLNGEVTDLKVEMWSNTYKVFVLMWVRQRERLKRKRIIVGAARA